MQLSIETNFPEVQRQIDLLAAEVANKATARALNRTIELARTAMSREIRSEFVIDARYVRERLRIKRASFYGGVLELQAALEAQAKPRSANVIRFGARQVAQGVSVKIRKSGGRKVIRGAFIGNKGRTVFRRVGKERLPIEPIRTIDVAQMFNAKRINARVIDTIKARFPEVWDRELAYALAQFNAR